MLAAYTQHVEQRDGFFRAHVPREMLDRAAMLDSMLNLPLDIKHLLAMVPLSCQHENPAETWLDCVRKVNRDIQIGPESLRSHPATAPLGVADMAVQQLWA